MGFILGASKIYSWDLELFQKLGLTPFSSDNQDELFVGNYKLPHYDKGNIKIFVTCMPAQFWRFEIETDEDKKFEVSTGSGSLSDYWSCIMKVAEGMLVINAL